jgi:hypothetical protein
VLLVENPIDTKVQVSPVNLKDGLECAFESVVIVFHDNLYKFPRYGKYWFYLRTLLQLCFKIGN